MEEPTIEEVLELVSFRRNADGKLYVRNVYGNLSHAHGNVKLKLVSFGQDTKGRLYVRNVHGNVFGDVEGKVYGKTTKQIKL